MSGRPDWKFIGGDVALDFVNTVDWRGAAGGELIADYPALVGWSKAAGLFTAAEAARLKSLASGETAAGRVHRRAIDLREALHRLLGDKATGRGADAAIAVVNRELARAPARRTLARAGAGVDWIRRDRPAPDAVLWPIVWAAADLLTSVRAGRVKSCANASCGWLFIDVSRSGRRKWCSMADCGNRAKVRRHYWRNRAKTPG